MKVVALLNSYPEIELEALNLQKIQDMYHQKMEFLKKGADDAAEWADKESKKRFEIVRDFLLLKGIMPKEYSGEAFELHISLEQNAVIIKEKCKEGCPTCAIFGRRHI